MSLSNKSTSKRSRDVTQRSRGLSDVTKVGQKPLRKKDKEKLKNERQNSTEEKKAGWQHFRPSWQTGSHVTSHEGHVDSDVTESYENRPEASKILL